MTRAALARHFGIRPETVTHWTRGTAPIPGSAARWVELALAVTAELPGRRKIRA